MTRSINIFTLSLILVLLAWISNSQVVQNRLLQDDHTARSRFYRTWYVERNDREYYSYDIFIKQGKLVVSIIDQELRVSTLTYWRKNDLYYRASYRNFIIVQEMLNQKQTVSYWVITIEESNDVFKLSAFAISSTIDNYDWKFNNQYILKSVLEYNEEQKWLYVKLYTENDTDVYAIDVGNKGGNQARLMNIGWFYHNKTNQENIIGGNSRVLVEAKSQSIYIDPMLVKKDPNTQPTKYIIKPISSLTNYPVYSHSRVFNLQHWNFIYVSQSQDRLKASGFIYSGYGSKSQLYGWFSLSSKCRPIRYFSNDYSFFVAVSDNDVYIATLDYNPVNNSTYKYAVQISKAIGDVNKKAAVIRQFNAALYVVHANQHLYVLTETALYSYDKKQTIVEYILKDPVRPGQDLIARTFSQIYTWC